MSQLRHLIRGLALQLQWLRHAQEGAAAVEFALIVPFLITLYMGTIEISDLIAVDRRVNVVAGTIGDLVARSDGSVSSTELSSYFDAAQGIILPYSRTGLKQVVTLVEVSSTGATTVKWSVGNNGGVAKTVGQPYPGFTTTTPIVVLAKSNYIVVGETSYSYRPLLGWVIKNAISLHRESYYLPRFGSCIKYGTTGCT